MAEVRQDVYDRIIKAINFEEPDRVPIWEALENQAIYAPHTMYLSQDAWMGFIPGYDHQTFSVLAAAIYEAPDAIARYWDYAMESAIIRNSIFAKHRLGPVIQCPDDIVECGFDGINPIDPSAGMDIGAIKRKYGNRLILVGNVDGSRILPFGREDDVRKEVRRCILAASTGGGHLLQCGSGEIMPDIPLQNVLAYMDEARKFGHYPIKDSCKTTV